MEIYVCLGMCLYVLDAVCVFEELRRNGGMPNETKMKSKLNANENSGYIIFSTDNERKLEISRQPGQIKTVWYTWQCGGL